MGNLTGDLTGVGEAVTGVKDILGMFFPDKTEEEKVKMAQALQLAQLQAQANAQQVGVNQVAAEKQPFTFRDGAGWVCVVSLGVVVLRPLIEWSLLIAGHPVHLPAMDTTETMPMLISLLGLTGAHAYQATRP